MLTHDFLKRYDWAEVAQDAIFAVVIFAAFYMASRLVCWVFNRVRKRLVSANAQLYVAEKLLSYALIVLGILIALSVTGIDMTSLAVFAGAIGVGVGLGLQGIVKEFVSGMLIIFDPNIRVGDFIQINDDLRGEITEVGPRATRLRTNDNLHIAIPNSALVENQVINWTYLGGTRRLHVPFSVAFDCDKTRVREVVLKAARELPFTLKDTDKQKNQVWLKGFSENTLNFELVVWPTAEAVRRPASLMAAYNWAIDTALRAEGLGPPLPQTDLNLRSLFGLTGKEALDSLGLKPQPAPKSQRVPAPPNDAVDDVDVTMPPDPVTVPKKEG